MRETFRNFFTKQTEYNSINISSSIFRTDFFQCVLTEFRFICLTEALNQTETNYNALKSVCIKTG